MAMPPAVSGVPAARASATRSSRSMARPRLPACEPVVPTCLSPAITGTPASGAKLPADNRHDAGSRGAAMLHARHHLLADVAAFVEIDAGELVHVGLVREGVAIDEVEPAARHAQRDAVRLVGRRLEQLCAKVGRRLLGQMRRQHDALAERWQPRVSDRSGRIRSCRRRPRPPSRPAPRTGHRRSPWRGACRN